MPLDHFDDWRTTVIEQRVNTYPTVVRILLDEDTDLWEVENIPLQMHSSRAELPLSEIK